MRFWRLALASLFLVACTQSARGPAWPKPTDKAADGGESLSPRPGALAIAATQDEAEDEDDDIKVVTTPTAVTPAAGSSSTSTSSPTVTAPEETITIEDIVIEIDD